MKKNLLILLFLVCTLPTLAAKKYASPSGSASNSGNSLLEAWSLEFALGTSSPLLPGDSLMMADGTYPGNFISELYGTAEKPIRIMPLNAGKAIIDAGRNRSGESGILVKGNYTWFIGIHVTSSSTNRNPDASNGFAAIEIEAGITVTGDHNKLINCWIYDVVGGGLQLWRSGLNLEVYGCVVFNNGFQEVPRGYGHGMYIQHDEVNFPKEIVNNIVFQNASQGINIYTTNPINRGLIVDKNVSFNTGVFADFNPILFRPPHNLSIGSRNNLSSDIVVTGNIFYSDLQGGRLEPSGVSNVTLGRTFYPNLNFKFTGNKIYGGRNQVELLPASRLSFTENLLVNTSGQFISVYEDYSSYTESTWKSNAYINFSNSTNVFNGLSFSDWKLTSGFDGNSNLLTIPQKPAEILVVQNKYDSNLYYVTILNLSDQEVISVDFSQYAIEAGIDYVIRDVQNPFDEVHRKVGKKTGEMISFPMNWTNSMQPKGNIPHQVKHTDKTFGSFILEFSKRAESERREVKDSVAIYLNYEGKAFLKSDDFLEGALEDGEPFTFTSSKGFEFDCENLGFNEVTITSKNTDTNQEWVDDIRLYVLDTIAPKFEAANAYFLFDPVVGKISISIADFDVVDFRDNCSSSFWNITMDIAELINEDEVTCADIYQNPDQPIFKFPVVLTATDPSGNSFSKNVNVIVGNVQESKKVSLTQVTPLYEGGETEIKLGDELQYEVLGWYRMGGLINESQNRAIKISKPEVYYALLMLESGCTVKSDFLAVQYSSADFPPVKARIELLLDGEGKAELTLEDVFQSWPSSNPSFTATLSKSAFNCENIGAQLVNVIIKDDIGNTWEEKIEVVVQDKLPPVLKVKNIEVELDLTVDGFALKAEDFIESISDNCSITSLTINKQNLTCMDVGKEVTVELRAEDGAGNVTEKTAKVFVTSKNASPVTITGNPAICAGEQQTLTLKSAAEFEVLRWRRNGTEITGAKNKILEITQGGSYQAVILYSGGCLFETNTFAVETITTKPVIIQGSATLCAGQKQTLALVSDEAFEVVRWRKNGTEIPGAKGTTLEISEGGSYHAVVQNTGGCLIETAKFEVEISPEPTGEITVDGNILSAPDGNFIYQWFRNGDKIAGATQRTLTVNQMGEFAVELTNEAGCMARLKAVTLMISGIFNPSILVTEELKIYPNPASSEVKVQALGDLEFAGNSMRVFNSTGADVSSSVEVIHQSPREITLAISRLAAGIYVIMLESP
ncbi:MAG: T9SS type A sorting domain-containing protein, partial [Algoriphagus sp.]